MEDAALVLVRLADGHLCIRHVQVVNHSFHKAEETIAVLFAIHFSYIPDGDVHVLDGMAVAIEIAGKESPLPDTDRIPYGTVQVDVSIQTEILTFSVDAIYIPLIAAIHEVSQSAQVPYVLDEIMIMVFIDFFVETVIKTRTTGCQFTICYLRQILLMPGVTYINAIFGKSLQGQQCQHAQHQAPLSCSFHLIIIYVCHSLISPLFLKKFL